MDVKNVRSCPFELCGSDGRDGFAMQGLKPTSFLLFTARLRSLQLSRAAGSPQTKRLSRALTRVNPGEFN